MTTYTDVNGVSYTDQDLEAWANQAERGEEYTGKHRGPSQPGRPISIGKQARPFTLRLDARRREKVQQAAKERNITASQLIRELIDEL